MSSEELGINIKADLEPVLKATPTGIKYIFNLLFGKKHSQAERMLMLADAQNAVDVKKILSGNAYFDHKEQRLIEVTPSITKSTIAASIEEDETSNLIECSIHAAAFINENEKPEPSLDRDNFINKWRNEAKFISTETAQIIWGRVLAEEINSPSSISLRTLDIIKNLSQREAKNFNHACKFVFFDSYVAENGSKDPILEEIFSSIRDAGLLVSYSSSMYTNSKWPETRLTLSTGQENDVFYLRFGKLFIFLEKQSLQESDQPPKTTFWELTTAGRELYQVIKDTVEITPIEAVNSLSKLEDEVKMKIKYTHYTNIEAREVDTLSIREIFTTI